MLDYSSEGQKKFLEDIGHNPNEIYRFLAEPVEYAANYGIGLSAEVLNELPKPGTIRDTMEAAPGGAAAAAGVASNAARAAASGFAGGVLGALGARAVDAALSIDADMSAMAKMDNQVR